MVVSLIAILAAYACGRLVGGPLAGVGAARSDGGRATAARLRRARGIRACVGRARSRRGRTRASTPTTVAFVPGRRSRRGRARRLDVGQAAGRDGGAADRRACVRLRLRNARTPPAAPGRRRRPPCARRLSSPTTTPCRRSGTASSPRTRASSARRPRRRTYTEPQRSSTRARRLAASSSSARSRHSSSPARTSSAACSPRSGSGQLPATASSSRCTRLSDHHFVFLAVSLALPAGVGLGLLAARVAMPRPALAALVAHRRCVLCRRRRQRTQRDRRRERADATGNSLGDLADPHANTTGAARRLGPADRPLPRAPPDARTADRHVDRSDRPRGPAVRGRCSRSSTRRTRTPPSSAGCSRRSL